MSACAFAFSLAVLVLERPLGLLALLLPLAVLLLARSRTRPELRATGTFALWRELCERAPAREARARRSIPPRTWLAVAALCLGSLALAGPRGIPARGPRLWRVFVDRSPSMHLEWRAPEGADVRPSRLSRALELFEERMRAELAPDDEIEWVCFGPEGRRLERGRTLPDAWREPPPHPWPEPEWALLDEPGAIWLSDARPALERRCAALCASGGAAVPGCVGRAPGGRLDWDGERLLVVEGGLPPATYALLGGGELPHELRALVALWAEDRGLAEPAQEGALVELELRASAQHEQLAVVARRAAWSLRGRAGRSGVPGGDERGALSTWLLSDEGLPLVGAGPGRVQLAIASIEQLEGDPAAFALDWAKLLDASRLPAPGAVAVRERAAAGPSVLEPALAPPRSSSEGRRMPIGSWLAFLAAVLALLAFSARPARSRARPLGEERRASSTSPTLRSPGSRGGSRPGALSARDRGPSPSSPSRRP